MEKKFVKPSFTTATDATACSLVGMVSRIATATGIEVG